ncbi:MAG TPA: FAD-dependent oxidoreductase, partial [Candidatus Hydrogenedentes bacterium]|nr:FAD-dependent oxidoreductase [Candidatus Hydrogenedentota bacterium]
MPNDASQVSGAVAVIGAGIAGIQASLDLAGMGFRVWLVEERPAIGGLMAMLDKTFPTNDCSLCILSPKLVECGRHKDIEILTCTDVLGLEGAPGRYTLRVRRNPRRVDPAKCTSCGACAEKCPINIPNAYEQGLSFRKAIYKYYPQAIPNAWVVDDAGLPPHYRGCIRCGACVKACATGAVCLEEEPEEMSLSVGAVILAAGASAINPSDKPEFGYGRFLNVLTSLEFERVLSASGPYDGHVLRPSDREKPRSVAWIQCVGSRDRQAGRPWCSSVCCMYAVKEAVISREHDADLETSIFYIDMRAFGRDFDPYVERARDQVGVRFVRSRVSEIVEDPETRDLFVRYEDDSGEYREERFGMVVLSAGLCVSPQRRALMDSLGLAADDLGFCRTSPEEPAATSREGVFVAGTLSGPAAIPESVMQASAAASRAAAILSAARGIEIREVAPIPESDLTGAAPRVGVFVCHCGVNIAGYLDVAALADYAATLEDVVYVDHPMYSCAQDSQARIVEIIREHRLNRVVVSACSPRTHEALFQETLRQAGLNPSLFEMANIRDQCSWIHMNCPEAAQAKARDLIAMAVAKARLLEPLPVLEVPVTPAALVVGAGPAGMSAALALADQGYPVTLVEKEDRCGGRLPEIHHSLDGLEGSVFAAQLEQRVRAHERVTLHLGSRLEKTEGFVGNFRSMIATPSGPEEVEHGAIVLAIGAQPAVPDEYLYGTDPAVCTQEELERELAGLSPEDMPDRRAHVMIQCVGCRNGEFPSCGRVCCAQAVKNALRIKELNPRAEVFVLYRDMRTYGRHELHYEKARDSGVVFLRYDPENPPRVERRNGRLSVTVYEQFLRKDISLAADVVALSSALRASDEARALGALLKVPL